MPIAGFPYSRKCSKRKKGACLKYVNTEANIRQLKKEFLEQTHERNRMARIQQKISGRLRRRQGLRDVLKTK